MDKAARLSMVDNTQSATPEKLEDSKRAQNRATNRQAILHAAQQVFAERGYGTTTVRDIIRRTNLATGTFYNYFQSKDEIFNALIAQTQADLNKALRDARRQADNFEDFVHKSYLTYFSYYAENRSIYEMMRANRGHTANPKYSDDPHRQTAFHELREDLEKAIADDLLPAADVDFLTAAASGVALAVLDEMMNRDITDPVAAAQFTTDIFLGRIKNNET